MNGKPKNIEFRFSYENKNAAENARKGMIIDGWLCSFVNEEDGGWYFTAKRSSSAGPHEKRSLINA
jgi:hypothetical protein